jgi:PAS domain S-box-containing protein
MLRDQRRCWNSLTVNKQLGRLLPVSPNLAALLQRHRDEIINSWAEMVHTLPDTRYRDYPLAELRAWLSRGLAVAIETLASGSYHDLETHLRDISLDRLQMGFDISEVIEALLLLREAALPVLWQSYPLHSSEAYETLIHFDGYLRRSISRFGHLYAQAMERELRRSEERFRTLADFTYDWEYWLNPEGHYVYVSPSCERITGYRADEFQQDPGLLETIIHASDQRAVAEHLRSEPIEGSVVHPIQFRIITRTGEERWLEHVCQPVYGSQGKYLGRRGSNRDITERKRAERALEEQTKEKAVAAERTRLARELHDSVTQALYSVTLYAEATRLALLADKQDVATENLGELHNMAREAMVDMRMLIFELHPPVLEEEGLVAALQARLAAVESRVRMQTSIRVEGERRLPLLLEEQMFRIALESLNNVIKHAAAQQVTVDLSFEDDGACLEIIDDGVGFDPAVARGSGGMGLLGMEERVQRIGGTLAIESAPGRGTTVRVKIRDTGRENLAS